ncbi:MAG: carboxy terminal-processing peptidase [Verrucomicrobia bacterium]|nr:carboxy terminal-processing peptidase [Verrucomicrobiota bacterium]MBT6805822.1 carboxy terminal-processing peptidase [Verrucomicrobiota bacterium]
MKTKFRIALCLLLMMVTCAQALELSMRQSGKITEVVGHILSQSHLRQKWLDNDISNIFFDNYLDSLDLNHQIFLQSDVDKFREKYQDLLDDYTFGILENNRVPNAAPAFEIFERFKERIQERRKVIGELLDQEYKFDVDDEIMIKRSEEPWPKTEAEARELWRLRIKYDLLQGRLGKEEISEVKERLSKRYDRLVKDFVTLEPDEVLQIYLTALSNAYDPHSNYMSPTTADDFYIKNVHNELTGIGALLRSNEGYCQIVSLVPGGPADKSKKIKPGDKIIAVAQDDDEPVDVVEMKLNKVVQLIRGKLKSKVKLTIIPAKSVDGSETRELTLVREKIELKEQFAKARIVELPTKLGKKRRLAVLTVPQYYENVAADTALILKRLGKEDIEGVALDLRRNGGGILPEAVELTGLFFPEGPVVQVQNYVKQKQVLKDEDPSTVYDGPLVVMVSNLSASAAEITAAALQDYGRALIVGDKTTHGKGTVQTLVELNKIRNTPKESGLLKYTISKFYRVEGSTTQRNGVTPDIILPSIYDYMELGEAHLPQSLEPDSIDPADYEIMHRVRDTVDTLKKTSAERIKTVTDFQYIMNDIKRYQETKERKTVSLNEEKRAPEKEEDKARIEKRDAERKARRYPGLKIFRLTMDEVRGQKPAKLLFNGDNEEDYDVEEDEEEEKPKDGSLPEIDENSYVGDDQDEMDKRLDPYTRESIEILKDYIDELNKADKADNPQLPAQASNH